MGNLANTIYMAVVSHTSWKKRLHNIIETGKYEVSVAADKCEFSQWLQANRAELEKYKNFAKVEELHEKFHAEGSQIVRLATTGKKKEAGDALNYGSVFDSTSQELVRHIIAWHDEVSGK